MSKLALAIAEHMDRPRLTAERLDELIAWARKGQHEDVLSALLELKVRRGLSG